MSTPSVRLLTAAVWALLDGHPYLVAFQSEATKPPTNDEGALTKGYAVFHPGGGDDTPNSLNAQPGRLLWGFQLTCVGGSHDQLGWVLDEVRGLFTGQTLTVAGVSVGVMRPPLGFVAPPARPELDVSPTRLMVPLQYQVLATA